MPTRTPAERERVLKKRRKQKLFLKGFFVLLIALFLIYCETSGKFKKWLMNSPDPTQTPKLPNAAYCDALGIEGYTSEDDNIRIPIKSSGGDDGILIVSNNSGFAVLKLLFPCKPSVTVERTPHPFSGVDPTEYAQEAKYDLAQLKNEVVVYLEPLFSATDGSSMDDKLINALKRVCESGESSSSFICGLYSISISAPDSNGLITISAQPSK